MVKLGHTVFALPFALTGYFFAVKCAGYGFEWGLLVKVLLCMVFARNAAMTFNRWADRKIDARNPRTKSREIPSGVISPRNAMIFLIVNCVLFIVVARFINRLAFSLSPVALAVILGYTLTKRFTPFCHIFIGLALSIAPMAAYVAVTGRFGFFPLMLSVLVLTWVSGFDIIYSLQDTEFDRVNGVKSIPSAFGIPAALWISAFLHLLTVASIFLIGIFYASGVLYWMGGGIFTLLLIYQHAIVSPGNLSRVNTAFGTLNGIASICYAAFVITGFYI